MERMTDIMENGQKRSVSKAKPKPAEYSVGKQRELWGKRAGAIGMGVNFTLFLLKVISGTLSGSIAVIADAVNNLSDSANSTITYLGFRLSGKPADKEHPFGHARMEYISGFLVSVIIVFLGLQLGKTSIEKIIRPQDPDPNLFMILVLAGSIAVKLGLWVFYARTGKKILSVALFAAAADSRNDVITTSAILLSIAVHVMTGGRVNPDGLMGLVVSVMILYFGIRLVSDTMSTLIGAAPPPELVDKLSKKILTYQGVTGLHDLEIHSYGYGAHFASVHCEVPAGRNMMESHDLADNIEREVRREMNIHLVIHLDPIENSDPRTNEAREKVEGILQSISPLLSMHDFRAVWSLSHTNFIFDVAVPFDFALTDEELSTRIRDAVSELDPTYFAVLTFDKR